ncbi:ABC transporter permease [Methanospirillum sp. J.3.6.1-F.2.7.3]|uniref:ABC transporter permease n=1 Tax=Methanospirillum purgamenti TaxID=2834276 RepID=A0A8E7B1A2_9EURY|nr:MULTISPECIES: ABC transporter permease [Methanospirillum]MDX8549475.1 ABC transporter permease [Methanospirillum hungatei]QVV89243.1 ABC transporter permease [Methanospirillum sp. J.3.6.1-F.2.7.3]
MNFLITYHELIINFIKRDLEQRYVGSLLGVYWSFINPIITLIVYFIVFGYFLMMRLPNSDSIWDFFLYFAAGFLPWAAFQSTLLRVSSAIIDNKNYVKKVPFPSEIFPLYVTLAESVNLLIGILIYFIFFLILKGIPGFMILLLPGILIIQIIFTLGFSFLLSAGTVFFRDIPQIVGSIFQIWFWITPIVYVIDIVPEEIRWLLYYNPMYYLLEFYRDSLFYNVIPDLFTIGIFIVLAGIFYWSSLWVFISVKRGFSELL